MLETNYQARYCIQSVNMLKTVILIPLVNLLSSLCPQFQILSDNEILHYYLNSLFLSHSKALHNYSGSYDGVV